MGFMPIFCSSLTGSLRRTIPEESLQCIHRICAANDCQLVDFAIRGSERRLILDLFIDNRQGVSLELCSQVSRTLNDESATDKFLSDVYQLEVSSPGVDRPLTFNWQYDKHVGRTLSVTCTDGSVQEGVLVRVEPEAIVLRPTGTKKSAPPSEDLHLAFDHISSSTVRVSMR